MNESTGAAAQGRREHAQQQAQQRHPNKAGPIRDVAAPRTAQAPAIYLPSLSLSIYLSQACLFGRKLITLNEKNKSA